MCYRLRGLPRDSGTYTCRATYPDGTEIGRGTKVIRIRNRQCPTSVTIDGKSYSCQNGRLPAVTINILTCADGLLCTLSYLCIIYLEMIDH